MLFGPNHRQGIGAKRRYHFGNSPNEKNHKVIQLGLFANGNDLFELLIDHELNNWVGD